MSILVDKNTRLICQGITGKAGQVPLRAVPRLRHQPRGGVTPGRGGESVLGVPVFDTTSEAVKATSANASMIFVPPPRRADAILEAADAGIPLIIAITEGIPVLDMARAVAYLKAHYPNTRLIGPNCPGRHHPGQCKIGIMPGYIHKPGQGRRRQPLGDLDLRRGLAAHEPRASARHLRRHRWRSDQRDRLRGRCGSSRPTPTPRPS